MTDQKTFCPICNNNSNLVHQFNTNGFLIIFCRNCHNGFTDPQPKNISAYYHHNYWSSPGFIGYLKKIIYKIFQARRTKWVEKLLKEKKAEILDVGAGEGSFAKSLQIKYSVISIDTIDSKIKNKSVVKTDFLKWTTGKKFDAIVFWESLEHTDQPQKYLAKAIGLLKNGGYILIEYPQFNSLEAKIFGRFWFHLDPPRHLVHLTNKGLETLLSKNMEILENRSVLAFEYTVWGFTASILNFLHPGQTDFFKTGKEKSLIVLLVPILLISLIIQLLFAVTGQSAIGLIIGQKQK